MNHSEAKEYLNKCYYLYKEYQWLLDSYVVDFFVNNYWDKLLPSWRNFFEKNEPQIVADVLNINQKPIKNIFPLSLLAAKTFVQNVTLNRKLNDETFNDSLYQNVFAHTGVNKSFWKHVKQKKVHEISLFGKKCAEIAWKTQIDLIVDCGSGLGHLARLLAYKYKLNLVCLEAQESLTKRAVQLDQEFERRVMKYDGTLLKDCHRPTHINYMLKTYTTVEDLLKIVSNGNKSIRFGLIGLHPCGDLASALLRLFKSSNQVVFTCVVGCCYMKLTNVGHPLSKELTSCISYEARELACHATERLIEEIRNEGVVNLRTHAWRATLEEIIIKHYPNMKHAGLRSVKYSKEITFSDYCSKALEGREVHLIERDINSDHVEDMLMQVDKVVIFNCLRTFFAPVLETIVLLDRLLFLNETEGITAVVEPVFDPLISSRNHLLTAYKS